MVVDPPVQELMKTPHVLAVLSQGYTPEQVEEVFNRFGKTVFCPPSICKSLVCCVGLGKGTIFMIEIKLCDQYYFFVEID